MRLVSNPVTEKIRDKAPIYSARHAQEITTKVFWITLDIKQSLNLTMGSPIKVHWPEQAHVRSGAHEHWRVAVAVSALRFSLLLSHEAVGYDCAKTENTMVHQVRVHPSGMIMRTLEHIELQHQCG